MKSSFWKQLSHLAVAGAIVLSLGTGATAQKTATGNSGLQATLQGTWTVTVQTVDCTSGAPLGSPFLSLLTFDRGGTMTETTSNPNFYPNDRGPSHGVWTSPGSRSYSAASTAFITSSGALIETQVIRQTILMGTNPDQFKTVKASVEFFDVNGNLLVSGCATATGQRFQ